MSIVIFAALVAWLIHVGKVNVEKIGGWRAEDYGGRKGYRGGNDT